MTKPCGPFNPKDYKPFSAWDDAKFTIWGLLALCSPIIVLGLILLALLL